MANRKYQGEDIVLSLDLGAAHSGVTDIVCDITDLSGAAIATVTLTEAGAGSGSYRGSHTTTQTGAHHCRIHSPTLGIDESGLYDVRPASEAPAQVAQGVQALQTPVISVSFA